MQNENWRGKLMAAYLLFGVALRGHENKLSQATSHLRNGSQLVQSPEQQKPNERAELLREAVCSPAPSGDTACRCGRASASPPVARSSVGEMRPVVAAMQNASCRTLRSFNVICSRLLLISRVPKPKIFCTSSTSGTISTDSSEESSEESPGHQFTGKDRWSMRMTFCDELLAYTCLRQAEFLFLPFFLLLLFLRALFALPSFSTSPLPLIHWFRRRLLLVSTCEHPRTRRALAMLHLRLCEPCDRARIKRE